MKTIVIKLYPLNYHNISKTHPHVDSKFYLQIKYWAMGTICAPVNAIIFMAEFEQKYIYPLIKDKSILFLRYIDDIFMVWIKPKKQLKDFMNELNQKHSSIKLDYKFDW